VGASLNFAETEADGGRDLSRGRVDSGPDITAAFCVHAADEGRHAEMFRREQGDIALTPVRSPAASTELGYPGGARLMTARSSEVGCEPASFSAFIGKNSAAGHFATYVEALKGDPLTSSLFKKS